MLVPQFDACASWWTQGPDSNLQVIVFMSPCFYEILLTIYR
jgi:hypothetical protein